MGQWTSNKCANFSRATRSQVYPPFLTNQKILSANTQKVQNPTTSPQSKYRLGIQLQLGLIKSSKRSARIRSVNHFLQRCLAHHAIEIEEEKSLLDIASRTNVAASFEKAKDLRENQENVRSVITDDCIHQVQRSSQIGVRTKPKPLTTFSLFFSSPLPRG